MLTHPTVDKLQQLRCAGMAKALAEQFDAPEVDALSFEERLGLLVDRELTERPLAATHQPAAPRQAQAGRLHRGHRLPTPPRPRPPARPLPRRRALGPRTPQRPHLRADRHRKELARLRAGPQRLPQRPQRALRARVPAVERTGHRARRWTLPEAARVARQDRGPGDRRLGADPVQRREPPRPARGPRGPPRRALDRRDQSELPVDKWHDVVGDPTLADAILDRLVHNAYKLDLKGDSMRKRRRPSTRTGNPDS